MVAMRSSVTSPSASLTAGKSAAAMGAMVGPAEARRRGWRLLAAARTSIAFVQIKNQGLDVRCLNFQPLRLAARKK